MPDLQRPATSTDVDEVVAAPATATQAPAATPSNQDVQDVVLYLTLNNTTHNKDEIPEAMSALKQAEHEGLGHREVLPISDPYWSKNKDGTLNYDEGTTAGVAGQENADKVTWWHGNDELESGQVKIGDEILTLGTSAVGDDPIAQQKVVDDWKKTVTTLGMDEESANELTKSLFENDDGSFRALDSGDGATNELVQFAMAMHHSEEGEIDVTNLVLSGHHWRDEFHPGDGQGIWGEVPGQNHVYDDTDDYFSLEDMASMKDAFPTAFAGVKSVQLAACNTDNLGMTDDAGAAQSTNEFLDATFENLEMSSYWKEVLAPLAASGAETNGEFLLDSMRMEGDRSDDAARDSRHNLKGLKRSLPGADGSLEEIKMSTSKASYTSTADGLGGGAKRDGFRDTNTAYDERADLADYLYQYTPAVTPEAPAVDETK
jgi:hypothetical protein